MTDNTQRNEPFALHERMHFCPWNAPSVCPLAIFRLHLRVFPRSPSLSISLSLSLSLSLHVQFILDSPRCSNYSSRRSDPLSHFPTNLPLGTKADNEDRKRIGVLAWQYDGSLVPNGLHGGGYEEKGRKGSGRRRRWGQRKIKSTLTAGNFHKTIPRVLINLSCSSKLLPPSSFPSPPPPAPLVLLFLLPLPLFPLALRLSSLRF